MFEQFEKYNLWTGVLYKKDNSDKTEFAKVISDFEAKGYKKVFENSFENAEFVTLANGKETVNVSYKGKNNTLRITVDEGANLPVTECDEKPVCDTLITQMKTSFFWVDCGMGYIIRLGDGNFVIIDGGMGLYDEPQHFLEILNEQKMGEGVPLIKAWFITHPHNDHFRLFEKMMQDYKDSFKLEKLIYNWPSREYVTGESDTTVFDELAANHNGFEVVTARTGYKFCYCGNEFEILFSPDDTLPTEFTNVNDTSIIIRQKVNGRTVLYLGDIMTPGTNILLEECDEKTLKAEILQVAHHGFWGGSDQLYRIINPETLLWPLPDYHYYNMTFVAQNDFIVHSDTIKNVFYSSLEETTLNMNEPVPTDHPYDSHDNEIIHNADFAEKSMLKLGWSCVRGGGIVYWLANAEFIDGGIKLTSKTEKPTLLEFVQATYMSDVKKYEVTLKGEILKNARLDFVYNYANPKEINENELINLEPEVGKFEYVITANEDAGTITVLKNGKALCEREYKPFVRHGVGIIFDDAEIVFNEVKVRKI